MSAFVTTTAFVAFGACGPVVPLIVVVVTVTPPSATPPIVALAPPWKSVPVMVTAMPPAEGPFAGEMLETVGAGEGSYVYVHAHVPDSWSGFVTTTAFPAPGAWAPVVPVRIVSPVTVTPLSATPPIAAVAPVWNVPVIVTRVPPDDWPFSGVMLVTVGGGRLVQFADWNVPTRVCQLKVPLAVRDSVVYQNVQSSTGSIAIEL